MVVLSKTGLGSGPRDGNRVELNPGFRSRFVQQSGILSVLSYTEICGAEKVARLFLELSNLSISSYPYEGVLRHFN